MDKGTLESNPYTDVSLSPTGSHTTWSTTTNTGKQTQHLDHGEEEANDSTQGSFADLNVAPCLGVFCAVLLPQTQIHCPVTVDIITPALNQPSQLGTLSCVPSIPVLSGPFYSNLHFKSASLTLFFFLCLTLLSSAPTDLSSQLSLFPAFLSEYPPTP